MMDREPQPIDLTPGIDPPTPFGSLSHWPCTRPAHLKERRMIPQIHSLGWPQKPILLSNPTIPLIQKKKNNPKTTTKKPCRICFQAHLCDTWPTPWLRGWDLVPKEVSASPLGEGTSQPLASRSLWSWWGKWGRLIPGKCATLLSLEELRGA